MLDKDAMSIGRSEDADIVVADPYIAPVHARIERQADGTFVIRRMGLNPIWLRGEPIIQTASMRAGDSFRLGQDIEFSFVWANKSDGKADATGTSGQAPRKPVLVEGGNERPLLKQPAVLATIGLVYLGLMGAMAIHFLSTDDDGDDAPSPARIKQEAATIPECLVHAKTLRKYSQASFNGSVDTRSQPGGAPTSYADLIGTPSDDTALGKAASRLSADYERIAVAALAAESRGDRGTAAQLYQKAYEIVPDINCSAARFALQRKAATRPQAEE